MQTRLRTIAASAALLSACGSIPLIDDSGEPQVGTPASGESAIKDQNSALHSVHGRRHSGRQRLATGQYVTPTIVPGSVQLPLNPGLPAYPDFVAGEAVKSVLGPDGKTLAILTAGHNGLNQANGSADTANSTQYLFLYDVGGLNKKSPKLLQVLKVSDSHVGLVFSLDGNKIYTAGGRDDVVYVFAKTGETWAEAGSIPLGHNNVGIGRGVGTNASGLALSKDGKTLVVANNYNDSISVIDTETGTVRYEHDLRPFAPYNEGIEGGVGGTFPFAVAIKGNRIAYVTSDRDREVIVIDISSPSAGAFVKRIKLDGNALGVTLDKSEKRLYVAQDNADQVAVIDTETNRVIKKIDARGPEWLLPGHEQWKPKGKKKSNRHTGAGTFSVTLSPDQRTLYAVNSGSNSIAVISIKRNGRAPEKYEVTGLLPTAYEPHDIAFSKDGTYAYIVNGKSVTGPNPKLFDRAANQYQFQLERASLVAQRVLTEEWALDPLTTQVAENNFYGGVSERDIRTFDFLRKRIKHVIYIIKENRTFDQVLGDLTNGANVDPSLVQYGQAVTPSQHKLASEFVTLDNFTDPGDGSMDGWSWSLQARVTNVETLTQQLNYGGHGLSYESEGANRNTPVGWPTVAERDAVFGPTSTTFSTATQNLPGGSANVLAGTANHASSDAPFAEEGGYVFLAVLAAGGTVRSYGVLTNNIGSIGTRDNPVSDPFAAGVVQTTSYVPALAPFTDFYFRGYNNAYPEVWRFKEWKREFDEFVANGNLPNLSMVRFGTDHTGDFGSALAGLTTPELQVASNDLAVGLLVQAVANSPYAKSTLIIAVEDDSQNGPDHVDSHRTTTYIAGPYVKKGALVSTPYSQVNVIRTIEDILGTEHINLNTAFQPPMTDVFDIRQGPEWEFEPVASSLLQSTGIAPLIAELNIPYPPGPAAVSTQNEAYWVEATKGLDFEEADTNNSDTYNRIVWQGIKGNQPYPKIKNPRVATSEALEERARAVSTKRAADVAVAK